MARKLPEINVNSYDSLFSTEEERQEAQLEKIIKLPIDEIHDFKNHPFPVRLDEEMQKLIDSIRDNGQLMPALVRPSPYNNGYEMISGHRRMFSLMHIGKNEIDVIVRDLDDDQATIIMVDSNIQRENILPTERGYAYKMKLEAMKHQGKRIDLTSSQVGTKLLQKSKEWNTILRADERLAKEIGESRNQIARYIRLTKLITKILDMIDERRIAFTVGVELSYLTEEEQYELYVVMDSEQCTPSISQANRMKRMSQRGILNMDEIYSIMEQEKPNQREQIKIRADSLAEYFPKEFTPKQKVELIEQLVKEWHEKQMKSLKAGKKQI